VFPDVVLGVDDEIKISEILKFLYLVVLVVAHYYN
jgi:hypothetical protein